MQGYLPSAIAHDRDKDIAESGRWRESRVLDHPSTQSLRYARLLFPSLNRGAGFIAPHDHLRDNKRNENGAGLRGKLEQFLHHLDTGVNATDRLNI